MVETIQSKSSIEQVINRYFEAIQSLDFATVANLYGENLAVWHNFSDAEQGKRANLEQLRAMEALSAVRYEVTERQIVGNRVAQRHRLHVTRPDGKSFDLPVAIFLTVENGLITRVDEYFDSAQLASLR